MTNGTSAEPSCTTGANGEGGARFVQTICPNCIKSPLLIAHPGCRWRQLGVRLFGFSLIFFCPLLSFMDPTERAKWGSLPRTGPGKGIETQRREGRRTGWGKAWCCPVQGGAVLGPGAGEGGKEGAGWGCGTQIAIGPSDKDGDGVGAGLRTGTVPSPSSLLPAAVAPTPSPPPPSWHRVHRGRTAGLQPPPIAPPPQHSSRCWAPPAWHRSASCTLCSAKGCIPHPSIPLQEPRAHRPITHSAGGAGAVGSLQLGTCSRDWLPAAVPGSSCTPSSA